MQQRPQAVEDKIACNMTTKRLSGLTMLIMYPGQKIDLEQVLDFFASMEQRRVDLYTCP